MNALQSAIGVLSNLEGTLANNTLSDFDSVRTMMMMAFSETHKAFHAVEAALLVHEGRMTGMATSTANRKGNILDNKAVSSIKTLSTKSSFREWNEKFVNVYAQARIGARTVFKDMASHIDKEVDQEFEDIFDDAWFTQENLNRQVFKEELYVVLIDKAEGEALTRIRGVKEGEGIEAYLAVYKWFTGTTGMQITERMKNIMMPNTPKNEADIADAIDRWTGSVRILASIKQEYELQEPFKMVALEQIMNTGRAKDYYESAKIQSKDFQELLGKCKDYASRRMKESRKSENDMDCSMVKKEEQEDDKESQRQEEGDQWWTDTNAVTK